MFKTDLFPAGPNRKIRHEPANNSKIINNDLYEFFNNLYDVCLVLFRYRQNDMRCVKNGVSSSGSNYCKSR